MASVVFHLGQRSSESTLVKQWKQALFIYKKLRQSIKTFAFGPGFIPSDYICSMSANAFRCNWPIPFPEPFSSLLMSLISWPLPLPSHYHSNPIDGKASCIMVKYNIIIYLTLNVTLPCFPWRFYRKERQFEGNCSWNNDAQSIKCPEPDMFYSWTHS